MTGGINRRTLLRGIGMSALAVPAVGLVSACGGSSDPAATLKKGRQQGVLKVGIANEPPYTKVLADGTVTGVEPDVLRAVLKKIGIPKIEGVITPYDQMIPGLQAGRWDVVAAGLFMKKSRCSQVLYSEPTIVSTESFGVRKGNPKKLSTVKSAKDSGAKIAALAGGFESGALKAANFPAAQIIMVRDSRSGIEAVKSGRADGFFLPTLSLNDLVKSEPTIQVTSAIADVPKTGAGDAFRKSDKELHDTYNKALDAMKKTPEFGEILKKWGFNAKDVEGVTTAQLCQTEG